MADTESCSSLDSLGRARNAAEIRWQSNSAPGSAAEAAGLGDLTRRARFPRDLRTLAFAGCISRAVADDRIPIIRGMTQTRFEQLLRSCFVDVHLRNGWQDDASGRAYPIADEFDDLLSLLLEHRVEDTEINAWLSFCIASACMAERHLWQDMGLPNRETLTRIMAIFFPGLKAKNQNDMKWKKFLYRELCQRAGLMVCRSPRCADCNDYANCFGPENATEASALRQESVARYAA